MRTECQWKCGRPRLAEQGSSEDVKDIVNYEEQVDEVKENVWERNDHDLGANHED